MREDKSSGKNEKEKNPEGKRASDSYYQTPWSGILLLSVETDESYGREGHGCKANQAAYVRHFPYP